MGDTTRTASDTVLSLMSENSTVLEAGIAGVAVVTIAAIGIKIYRDYKASEKEAEQKEMAAVDELYKLKLEYIALDNENKVKGYPPIYDLVDGKYKSMHMTKAAIDDMGNTTPGGSDVALLSYQESIQAAINKLRAYFYARTCSYSEEKGLHISHPEKMEDITAGVLSYLLYMLETRLLNFQGYPDDIKFVAAMSGFINGYATYYGEVSQHFERLAPVYKDLLEAIEHLQKHQETLSLENTVTQLNKKCRDNSRTLIKLLAKMVVSGKHAELVNTRSIQDLKEGVLQERCIKTQVLHVDKLSTHDEKIEISKSIFKEWISQLSSYYLMSLDLRDTFSDNDREQSAAVLGYDFFAFSEKINEILARKPLKETENELRDKEWVKKKFKEIKNVFAKSGNFIARQWSVKDHDYVTVTDDRELVDRAAIMAYFADLTHKVLSLHYLSAYLLKSIKQLGEIYVKNPRHFQEIFSVLAKLSEEISKDANKTKESFHILQSKNYKNMQEAHKESFPIEVFAVLDGLIKQIGTYTNQVIKCRDKAKEGSAAITKETVTLQMVEVVDEIARRYKLPQTKKLHKQSSKTGDTSKNKKRKSPAEVIQKSDSSSLKTATSLDLVEQLQKLTEEIKARILVIQKGELARAGSYFKIYDSLLLLQEKSINLKNEEDKPEKRVVKAKSILELTVSLSKKTRDFLNKNPSDRQKDAATFATIVHSKLEDEKNDFIDEHSNRFSRFIYENICSFGIFRTESRKRFTEFDEACQEMSLG